MALGGQSLEPVASLPEADAELLRLLSENEQSRRGKPEAVGARRGQGRRGRLHADRTDVALMQFHQGRLLDHVHVRVADLTASKRFYRAVLAAVGREMTRDGEDAFSADELYVTAERTPTTGLHIAFQA